MPTTSAEPTLPFPLNVAARYVDSFTAPTGPHEPRGDWRLSYHVLTLAGRGGGAGGLDIERKATDGGAVLKLRYERPLPGAGNRVVEAEMLCRADELATPVRWRSTVESLDQDGKPIPHTRLAKSGVTNDKGVEIGDGKHKRQVTVAGAWTVNWALFEAAGRLPRQASAPIKFTMLDHFDQPKANQTLSYRGAATVVVGQRRVQREQWVQLERGRIRKTRWAREGGHDLRVHAYDHLGDGIVPWVYWVDEAGRLLFAVSGLEGYVLRGDEPNG